MTMHRAGHLLAACALLVVTACGGPVGGEAAGRVNATMALPPSAVTAIRVTVTGGEIVGFLHGDMTNLGNGQWTGSVPNTPPGGGYVVTAYAYDGAVPTNPINDDTNLIYKGSAAGVTVATGATTPVTIVLLPYPNGGGVLGLNTPPHIVFGTYPAAMAATDTVVLSAAAWDPDFAAVLSYTWDDGGAGGTFTGSNPISDQATGDTVSISYQPAPSAAGAVAIRLTASDGQTTAAKTIFIDVAPAFGAVGSTLTLDAGPEIVIQNIWSQELVAARIDTLTYQVQGTTLGGQLTLSWSDSCRGGFTGYQTSAPPAPFTDTVVWVAPMLPPNGPGQCDLTLTVTDEAGASTRSTVVVWVNPLGAIDQPGKVAFVTSAMVDGAAFNGDPAAADAFCQQAADAGVVPAGTYRAYLSFQGSNAKDSAVIGPYYLPDGTPVLEETWTAGAIMHAMDLDEMGNPAPSNEAWTGTRPDGTFDPGQNQCLNWTSNSAVNRATAGSTLATDASWVRASPSGSPGYSCSDLKPIYCVQDCPTGWLRLFGNYCVYSGDIDPPPPPNPGNQ